MCFSYFMKQYWLHSDLEERRVSVCSARHRNSVLSRELWITLWIALSIQYFSSVAIDDGQVSQLLEQVGLPLPWQILKECCHR